MLLREEKGITLIEMLVSLAIISFLGLSFYQILSIFSKNFETQDAIAEMQQQGRFAVDLVAREISQTGYDPTGIFFNGGEVGSPFTGSTCNDETPVNADVAPILEASATVFHYLADLDEDGVSGGPNEHVRYEWVDASGEGLCGNRTENTLFRQSNSVAMQPVSSDIIAFEFQYFDDSNTLIPNEVDGGGNPIPKTPAERANIWRVVLSLTAQTDRPDKDYPDNDGYRMREFVHNIWLKNT